MGDVGPADYDSAMAGEPTELAPSADETAAHTAWALDDGPEWKPPFWTPAKVTGVAVGVAVVAAIAVAGFAGYHLRDSDSVPSAQPSPTTSETKPPVFIPSTPAAPAPRDARWFVNPDDPMDISHGSYSDADMRRFDGVFLGMLRSEGWAPTNPEFIAGVGKAVCAEYSRGTGVGAVVDMLRQRYSSEDVTALIASAELAYPDCQRPD